MNWMLVAILSGLALLAWALLLRTVARSRGSRRRVRRAAQRGYAAEEAAPKLLEAAGYTVLERHPEANYVWQLDAEQITVKLRADYLVAQGDRRFVVEVKTGGAARPRRRETRRQLLEYALYYDQVDGVLYLDGDAQTLHRTHFPEPHAISIEQTSVFYAPIPFFLGLSMGAAATWWICS